MRPDEIALYNLLRKERPKYSDQWPVTDPFAERIGMPWKRMQYILMKWSGKGWWDCGVSDHSGWFTDKAPPSLPVAPQQT